MSLRLSNLWHDISRLVGDVGDADRIDWMQLVVATHPANDIEEFRSPPERPSIGQQGSWITGSGAHVLVE